MILVVYTSKIKRDYYYRTERLLFKKFCSDFFTGEDIGQIYCIEQIYEKQFVWGPNLTTLSPSENYKYIIKIHEFMPFTSPMELNPTPTAVDDKTRRRICPNGCDRPVSVCLCHKIPREKIATKTKIIIIQHPHETRHKLATVPVLAKCLDNCEIVFGRRLRHTISPFLDSLCADAVSNPENARRVVFLFPGEEFLLNLVKRLDFYGDCVNTCVVIAKRLELCGLCVC